MLDTWVDAAVKQNCKINMALWTADPVKFTKSRPGKPEERLPK